MPKQLLTITTAFQFFFTSIKSDSNETTESCVNFIQNLKI